MVFSKFGRGAWRFQLGGDDFVNAPGGADAMTSVDFWQPIFGLFCVALSPATTSCL